TVAARPAPRFTIAELIARCAAARDDRAAAPASDDGEHLLVFGPRWQSVQTIYYGDREALAVLEFPAAFADELRELSLHPALLDAATKFGVGYFGQEAYLPLSYRSLLLYGPLTRQLYSYLRCRDGSAPGAEVISFDFFLLDADGVCVVAIEEFAMKRVADEQALARSEEALSLAGNTQRASALTIEAEELYTRSWAGQQRDAGRILPHEGAETFVRALAQPQLSQAVVALHDIEHTIAKAIKREDASAEAQIADTTAATLNPRPALSSPYEAPRTPAEQQLAAIWQRVLGIEQVSIHDSFTELGGDSVLAIQVMAQAKTCQLTLTPNLIFQHQTIAALAAVLVPPAPHTEISIAPSSAGLPLTPGQARFLNRAAERPPSRHAHAAAGARSALGARRGRRRMAHGVKAPRQLPASFCS
ncbi:hypothetical protein HC891_15280, partial [Candidatus Gracilibacteria bacterium]|nr:hypothetical protein [Candidatus Gracilibacteria bacterium]